MLDRYVVPRIKPPLKALACALDRHSVQADHVTIIGFIIGLVSVAMLAIGMPGWGLVFLLLNRLADGVDGELARLHGATDAGGFLDITLDFIFYALFPLGFAIADPSQNALASAILIASFVGTGASFLAFSAMAEKRGIDHLDFAYKSFFYINGLAEGTETLLFFALMCLLPEHFLIIAGTFALICIVTAVNRVLFGYLTLRKHSD